MTAPGPATARGSNRRRPTHKAAENERNDDRVVQPLNWGDRELTLRPASAWRERYALADGEIELAVLDGKGWGRRLVRVDIDDSAALDPGLLLFAAFVVRGLAQDASAVAGASASTAATGS